jgi:hypothetical protein
VLSTFACGIITNWARVAASGWGEFAHRNPPFPFKVRVTLSTHPKNLRQLLQIRLASPGFLPAPIVPALPAHRQQGLARGIMLFPLGNGVLPLLFNCERIMKDFFIGDAGLADLASLCFFAL